MNQDSLKFYEFKIFLDENESEDSLAFHADIANKESYFIRYDLNETYFELFEDIINGRLSIDYVDNEEYISGKDVRFKNLKIKGEDALENIELFKEKFSKIYRFKVSFQKLNLYRSIGFVFDGPDYSLKNAVSLDALSNAIKFQEKMYKYLTVANNTGNVFIPQPKAGSIDLNVYTTKKPMLDYVVSFLKKIKEYNIDKQYLNNKNEESDLLEKIIKQLLELEKFKNLKSFTFKINDENIKFSKKDLDYFFKEYKKRYGEDIEYTDASISYVYKLKNSNLSSLVIDSRKYGTIHCHFENDEKKFKELLENSGKEIGVVGQKKSEKTIDLERFYFLIDIDEDEIPF